MEKSTQRVARVSNCLWSYQKPFPFRADLAGGPQLEAVAQSRALERTQTQLMLWKQTLASKESHKAMITILLDEALHYNTHLHSENAEKLRSQIYELKQRVLGPFDIDDNYLPALSTISRRGLFNQGCRKASSTPETP